MRRFDALLRRYWQLAALGGLFLLTIGIQSANAKLSGQIVSDQGDNFIRIMNMDGTQQVQITDGQGRVASPAWSPSGKKIAFSSSRVGSWSIYTINVDGTELRKLTSDRINDSSPDWSPDSQKIVYWSQGQIFRIDVQRGQRIQLTHNNVKNVYPAWSPRGDQIAYASNGEIWIMDTDGNNAKQLTDRVGQSSQPAWSPNGNRIAYSYRRAGGDPDIYVVKLDGKRNQKLVPMHRSAEKSPVWSPDGNWIIFTSMTFPGGDLNRDGIYVMRANGSGSPELLVKGFFNTVDWFIPSLSVLLQRNVPIMWGQLKRGF